MALSLNSSLSSVISNKRRVSAFKSLGLTTVADTLFYYPFRVTDPVKCCTLRQVKIGQKAAFAATVRRIRVVPMNARRGYRVEVQVDDADLVDPSAGQYEGYATFTFFTYKKHYADWLLSRLKKGRTLVASGEASLFGNNLQFTHPEILTVAEPGQEDSADVVSLEEGIHQLSRPQPIYHANSRISSAHIHESILGILQSLQDPIPDVIPEELSGTFMHRSQALMAIHNPHSIDEFWRGISTMRYEEALVSQTALLQEREKMQSSDSYICTETSLTEKFIHSLPFDLTSGQEEVISQIQTDMGRDYPMSRLLQGEVGSGKTVVALAALLQAASSGYQAVLVAPTQVLARQHYQVIASMLQKAEIDLPLVLLTGGMHLADRRQALAIPASGVPCIVVATHAAFSSTFQAPHVALEVIDEQHRFGVEQREKMREESSAIPHLLVMTATPIPRSAAMTWFGNLDISWLTELPQGRQPITSVVIEENDSQIMGQMFAHIRHRLDAGERAYVICPRIDDSQDADSANGGRDGTEETDTIDLLSYDADGILADDQERERPLHSVSEIAARLAGLPQFSGIQIATLTGRDDDETKDQVMKDFSSGTSPLLVATTVIEVGVDVPEASCIVVFDADRFGLSQLHQLRGRVGRGKSRSWAFFISRAPQDSLAAQRLEVIRSTSDGAKIAQADLELRGAGDVLGDAQSGGRTSFKLLRVVKDADIISSARKDADNVLVSDPNLSQEGHLQLAGAVLDFTRGKENLLIST